MREPRGCFPKTRQQIDGLPLVLFVTAAVKHVQSMVPWSQTREHVPQECNKKDKGDLAKFLHGEARLCVMFVRQACLRTTRVLGSLVAQVHPTTCPSKSMALAWGEDFKSLPQNLSR